MYTLFPADEYLVLLLEATILLKYMKSRLNDGYHYISVHAALLLQKRKKTLKRSILHLFCIKKEKKYRTNLCILLVYISIWAFVVNCYRTAIQK